MDKYDKQIQELTEYPELIINSWNGGFGLFAHCRNNQTIIPLEEGHCGCITQVKGKSDYIVPGRPDLTQRIRDDPRIPEGPYGITVESLPVFAEWQRILGVELGRKGD